MPVTIDALLGEHTPETEYTLVYLTPSSAKRLRFGVLIVESFGQAAAALTAHGLDKSTYENKLVFLMGVEKARFRNPVIPDCKLILKIEAIRSHGRVWKYKGEAFVDDKKMADAIWSATIVDKK